LAQYTSKVTQVALRPFDLRCLQFLKHFSKPWSKEVNGAAVELRKANVPLATIRKQLKLSERILPRILTQKKQNPGGPILDKKKCPGVESMLRRLQDVIERDGACNKYYTICMNI
jgi:hypothetical protein